MDRSARCCLWLGVATAAFSPAACALDSLGLGTGGAAAAGAASAGGSTGKGGAGEGAPVDGGPADGAPDAPVTCGDGALTGGEACDGADLGGQSCAALGHTGGDLACTAVCQLDVSGCFDYPTDWFDVAWHHRRTLTLHHDKIAGDLADFPVLVVVTDPAILGKLAAGAADVLVTGGDGKQKLSHDLERFDQAGDELVLWVRVPALPAASDTVLYFYYGNASSPSQEDAAAVWTGEQAVWHLGDPVPGGQTGGTHHDATGHGHDGTQHGNHDGTGKIGRAQSFNGSSDYIEVAGPDSLVIGDADLTIAAWIKTASSSDMGVVLKAAGNNHVQYDHLFGVNHDAHKLGIDNGWVGYLGGATAIDDDHWHHVVWTQQKNVSGNKEGWDLWVDGQHESGNQQDTGADAPGWTLRLGAYAGGSYFSHFFSGAIDEVRISAVARKAEWILTSFRSQGDPGSFVTLGAEEGQLQP
jgi:biopolymer transport protein ExbB